MTRPHLPALGVGIAIGLLFAGMASISGQPRPALSPPLVGRFQTAFVSPAEPGSGMPRKIVLLDTITGELYVSDRVDWKLHRDLPKVDLTIPMPLPLNDPSIPRDKEGKIELKFQPGELQKLLKEDKKK